VIVSVIVTATSLDKVVEDVKAQGKVTGSQRMKGAEAAYGNLTWLGS
jgi:hypothetical protein